jgi:hypothetical protein
MKTRWSLLERGSAHRGWPFGLGIVAFALASLTSRTPFFGDDLLHNFVLRGGHFPGEPRGAWDLYRFADGGEGIRTATAQGIFPWWSNPHLRLAFFRPLSSLWRAADYAVWGEHPLPFHLETSLVFAATVVVVALLLRRMVGGPAALLGALFFAVDDAHALPLTWIANRYAVLAASFGFASLLAHVRARESGGSRLFAPLLFGAALASGETALGVSGYFVAYAWLADPKGPKAGLASLWPLLVPLASWAVPYRLLGYGAHGSAFYVDPIDTPLRFAGLVPLRLPPLALAQILAPPSETFTTLGEHTGIVALVSAVVALALYAFVWSRARAHRATSALLVGSLLAALPVCAVLPDDRSLLVPGVGVAAVVGIALARHLDPTATPTASFGARALFRLLAFVHLIAAPVLLPLRGSLLPGVFESVTARGAASIPSGPRTVGRTLVVLGAPDALFTSISLIRKRLEGGPMPARATMLTTQLVGASVVERTGPREIVIRNDEGELGGPFSTVFRDTPFRAGDVVTTDLVEARVMSLAPNGLPSAVRFTFTEPLEDLLFVVWQGRSFVEVPAPALREPRSYSSVDLMSFLQK